MDAIKSLGDDALRLGRALTSQADGACAATAGSEGVVFISLGPHGIAIMVRIDEVGEHECVGWVKICVASCGSSWWLPTESVLVRVPLHCEVNPSSARLHALIGKYSPAELIDGRPSPAHDPMRLLRSARHVPRAPEAVDMEGGADGEFNRDLRRGLIDDFADGTAFLSVVGAGASSKRKQTAAAGSKRRGLRLLCLGGGPATALLAVRRLGLDVGVAVIVEDLSADHGKACEAIVKQQWPHCAVAFHHDWHTLDRATLLRLSRKLGFHIVLATPPCEPFSSLGKREGFGQAGHRTQAYRDWVKIEEVMRMSKELWPACTLALENVPMSLKQRIEVTELMQHVMPHQQLIDAARSQPSSRARLILSSVPFAPEQAVAFDNPRRLTFRCCCVNGAVPLAGKRSGKLKGDVPALAACLVSGNVSNGYLGPHVSARAVELAEAQDMWCVQNKQLCDLPMGELERAHGRYNLVFDPQLQRVRSLYIGECEQLLGLPIGYTNAPGVSLTLRRNIVKNVMDVATTTYVLSKLVTAANYNERQAKQQCQHVE